MSERVVWVGTARVLGEPASQGSKDAFVPKGARRPVMVEADKSLPAWRGELQRQMARCAPDVLPDQAAYRVRLFVYVARPSRDFGTGRNAGKLKPSAPLYPTAGKDLDKVARACGDAGSGVWWKDDRQIVAWEIERRYSLDGKTSTVVQAERLVIEPAGEVASERDDGDDGAGSG